MRLTFKPFLLIGAALASSLTAAAGDKHHEDVFTPGTATQSRLAQQVRHELLMLPYYTVFDDLAFSVNGSTVTLYGAVTNPTLKSDAENVTKRVEGVTNVIDNIKVLPLSPSDWQIRRAMFNAIYGDPQIADRYSHQAVPSIHITVDNGHVTLEGVVNSEADKNLINIRANSVPGVFSVTNNFIVAT